MRKLMLLFVLLGSSAVAWAQDVIVKKDGSTVVCRVVEITETEVVYKKWNDLQGANYVLERSSVSSVSYQDGKRVDLSTAKNLYKPNNQNDGTQQYNDNALLAIDRAEHPKKKVNFPFKWVVKAGLSLDHMRGAQSGYYTPMPGFEVDFGILYPFKKSHFAIGFDAFFATLRAKYHLNTTAQDKNSSFGIGGSPYVGYNFYVAKNKKLFPYVGAFICGRKSNIAISYNSTSEISSGVTVGLDLGLNFNFTSNFLLNAHYKYAFNVGREIDYTGLEPDVHAWKFVIGVGYMF